MSDGNGRVSDGVVRVAAVGDLHCTKTSRGALAALFGHVAQSADVLALCGDLTDYGHVEEAEILASEFSGSPAGRLPTVAVLGNHDYEAGKPDEVVRILRQAGMQLLDGDAVEIKGVGFAGVKGFAGGFGRATLGAWGEQGVKLFVQEAVNEAMKLESALARLRTHRRIAVLHYSPIKETVENEPVEIFPWLGCSRLEEPLNRYPVTAVIHGHAHNGKEEGKTSTGTPVYNVALPLMRKTHPHQPGFRVLEVPVTAAEREGEKGAVAVAEEPPVATVVR